MAHWDVSSRASLDGLMSELFCSYLLCHDRDVIFLFLSHRHLHLSVHSAVWRSQRAGLRARCVLCILAQRGGGPHPDTDRCHHGWMDHEHLLGNGHGHPGQWVVVSLSIRLTVCLFSSFFHFLCSFFLTYLYFMEDYMEREVTKFSINPDKTHIKTPLKDVLKWYEKDRQHYPTPATRDLIRNVTFKSTFWILN